MTEKQKATLNKIIDALPNDCREAFREVAEYAVSLGYTPVLKSAKKNYADFSKSKIGRTILKIDIAPTPPRLAMKFYALPEYTGIFKETIEESVREHARLKYEIKPHCTGCMQRRNGRCNEPQGYNITLPDGKQGFICGFGIMSLPSFSAENILEVIAALKVQDDFFIKKMIENRNSIKS